VFARVIKSHQKNSYTTNTLTTNYFQLTSNNYMRYIYCYNIYAVCSNHKRCVFLMYRVYRVLYRVHVFYAVLKCVYTQILYIHSLL